MRGLSAFTQSRTPTPGEDKPRKGDPLLQKQASDEIERTAEWFWRNRLQTVTAALQCNGYDDAAESENQSKKRQLNDCHN